MGIFNWILASLPALLVGVVVGWWLNDANIF